MWYEVKGGQRDREVRERIGQGWTWGHVADQDRDSRDVLTRAVTQLRGTTGVKFRHLGSPYWSKTKRGHMCQERSFDMSRERRYSEEVKREGEDKSEQTEPE